MSLESCPWDALDPGTVAFCEARLCDWIVEPSNAWSSLAYVVVAATLFLAHTLHKGDARLYAVLAGLVLTGLGSLAFHGTGTFVGEVLDQVGMFMLSAMIISFVYARERSLSSGATAGLYAGLTVASTALLLLIRPIGIPLFALQLMIGLGWELRLWYKSQDRSSFKYLLQGLGIFGVSFTIWLTDISGAVCDPDNHFVTGHAIWHVLNALCIERLYRYYAFRLGLE